MSLSTRQQFKEWRQAAETQRRKHVALAWVWYIFGAYGVLDYIHRNGFKLPPDGIAASIPVLFLISVLAMYQGEQNQAATYRVEAKQESAEESAHS